MKEIYKKYLVEGMNAGERYSFSIPSGLFNGGAGSKFSRKTGNSMEFMEHRDYIVGDDLRQLDWNVYARSDKLTIKLYENEVSPCMDIVIDSSLSMDLENTKKLRSSLGLSALFATAAGNSGYMYKTWLTKEKTTPIINGNSIPTNWEDIDFSSNTNPCDSLLNETPMFFHNGVRILISDLLWSCDPRKFLSHFTKNATAIIIVQVVSKSDLNPEQVGNVEIKDSETGEVSDFFLDANAIETYSKTLNSHINNWSNACKECGAILITITAEDITKDWFLHDLLSYEILRIG